MYSLSTIGKPLQQSALELEMRHFPFFQVVRVKPSGRLPSCLDKLDGSVMAGIFACTKALFSRSLIWSCLDRWPIGNLHSGLQLRRIHIDIGGIMGIPGEDCSKFSGSLELT